MLRDDGMHPAPPCTNQDAIAVVKTSRCYKGKEDVTSTNVIVVLAQLKRGRRGASKIVADHRCSTAQPSWTFSPNRQLKVNPETQEACLSYERRYVDVSPRCWWGGRREAGVGVSSVAKQIPKPEIGRDRLSLLCLCMSRGPKDQPSLRPVALRCW
jgi:hypothetical protein